MPFLPAGYFWEHNGGFYFGGLLFYKTDPADKQVLLSLPAH
jgi:hypothetical protein